MAASIRLARPEDAEAVRQVSEEAFATVRSVYRPNPAAHANLSAMAPSLERLVAEVDGQVVGTVRFGLFDGTLRIVGLCVLPQYRRQGVARALIEELASVAKGKGCGTLALYTITKTGNVAIFERLGFHVISEQPDAYSISVDGEPLREACMQRRIT
jgi:predicted N-acetyltransferase YhbS